MVLVFVGTWPPLLAACWLREGFPRGRLEKPPWWTMFTQHRTSRVSLWHSLGVAFVSPPTVAKISQVLWQQKKQKNTYTHTQTALHWGWLILSYSCLLTTTFLLPSIGRKSFNLAWSLHSEKPFNECRSACLEVPSQVVCCKTILFSFFSFLAIKLRNALGYR